MLDLRRLTLDASLASALVGRLLGALFSSGGLVGLPIDGSIVCCWLKFNLGTVGDEFLRNPPG